MLLHACRMGVVLSEESDGEGTQDRGRSRYPTSLSGKACVAVVACVQAA